MDFMPNPDFSFSGPVAWYQGQVFITSLREPDAKSPVGTAWIRFAPGSRSCWHSHPRGQTLYVLEGSGVTVNRAGEVQRLCAGDVLYIEQDEEHWHGADPDESLTYIGIQEADQHGETVDWQEHVSDSDYTP